jgi:hypothetical protein
MRFLEVAISVEEDITVQKEFSGFATAFVWLIISLNIGCSSNFSKSLSNALVQTEGYDFRKTRWGFTQEMVTVSEQGKRLYLRKANVLMFNHRIRDVPCKIIYCFMDNRLRAAGYITLKPVNGAQRIVEHCVEVNGEPDQILNDGMLWFTDRSLYYVNVYLSYTKSTPTPYTRSGGILSHLLAPSSQAGVINYWDGVWAHIDRGFYEELHNVKFPLEQLTFYEKRLFGVLKRAHIHEFYLGQTKVKVPSNVFE